MSRPTIQTDHDIVKEVVGGIENLERKLEKDVTNLCTSLLAVAGDFRNSMESQAPNKNALDNLRQQLFYNYSAIYWSLKLHLVFHMGDDQALQHEKLKKLHDLLNYPEELWKWKSLPGLEHAVDPGSKVLEIVSMHCFSPQIFQPVVLAVLLHLEEEGSGDIFICCSFICIWFRVYHVTGARIVPDPHVMCSRNQGRFKSKAWVKL